MDRIDATISIKPSEVVNSEAPSKSDRVESSPSTKYQCPSLAKQSGMVRFALQACRKESLSNPNSAEIALERARMEFAAGYKRSTRLYLKKAAALGSREAARALKLLFPGGELVKPQSAAATQALRKQAGDLGFRNPAAIKMLPRKPAVKSVASKLEESVSAEALQMNKQKELVAKISAELKRIGCWSGASAGTDFKLGSSGNVLFDGPVKLALERLRERNPSVRSNVPHEDTLAIIIALPTGGGC